MGPGFGGGGSVALSRDIQRITPYAGFGEVRQAQLRPSFQYTFAYGLPTILFDTSVVTGSGGSSASAGLATTSSGATGGSTAWLNTRRYLQYRAGVGGVIRFTAMFAGDYTAGGTAMCGLINADDGYAVGYVGGVFGFIHRVGGVDTFYPQSAWDGPGATLDPTKLNIFEITYQYLGAGHATLRVADPDTSRLEYATNTLWINREVTPNLGSPSLPFGMYAENSVGGEVLSVSSASVGGFTENTHSPTGIHFGVGVAATGISGVAHVLTVRAAATYNGVANRIPTEVTQITASVDGTKNCILHIVKNAAVSGSPVWTALDAESSVEYDTTGTWTGGRVIAKPGMAKVSDKVIPADSWNLQLIAGESLSLFIAPVSGTTDATASITVKELR